MKKHILTLAVVLMSAQAFANIGGSGDKDKCPFGDGSSRDFAPKNNPVVVAQALNGNTAAKEASNKPASDPAKR